MVTEILRPMTVQEALKARALPGAVFLGGGTWLNARKHAEPLTLVSLEKLGLDSIHRHGGRCVIGAMATFQQIIDNPDVPAALRNAAGLTASRTLRNMMTMGGEVALHPADSALIPLLMAMEAEVTLAGKKRPVALKDILSGGAESLILSVAIPEPGRPAAVRALSRTSHSPRSLVVAAIASALHPAVKGLRIVASDCGGTPVRLLKLEAALEGKTLPPPAEIERLAGNEFSPASDIHGSSLYKAYMTRVLVADALQGAGP
ncbi:MAG TPA: FAD binding domain-containing protein [Spirochaetia bacterium]|nr:FAD binding domain-containing protein [Spirochaetia bacterium]